MKVISWGKEVWVKGSDKNRYWEAGNSKNMLDLTTHFVSFLNFLVIRTNGKDILFLMSYDYG